MCNGLGTLPSEFLTIREKLTIANTCKVREFSQTELSSLTANLLGELSCIIILKTRKPRIAEGSDLSKENNTRQGQASKTRPAPNPTLIPWFLLTFRPAARLEPQEPCHLRFAYEELAAQMLRQLITGRGEDSNQFLCFCFWSPNSEPCAGLVRRGWRR